MNTKKAKKYSEKLKNKLSTIKDKYIKIEGNLFDYLEISSGEEIYYIGKYEYYVNEIRYTYEKELLEPTHTAKFRVDQKVILYYNPDNPNEAYSSESMKRCLDYHPTKDIIIVIISIILILILFIFTLRLISSINNY